MYVNSAAFAFYEWLIRQRGYNTKMYDALTVYEKDKLFNEYMQSRERLNVLLSGLRGAYSSIKPH